MSTFDASASEPMKRLLPLLIAALLAPVAASTHETPHKVVYFLWNVGGEITKIPLEAMEECEALGPVLIETAKISRNGKGYECIHGLM